MTAETDTKKTDVYDFWRTTLRGEKRPIDVNTPQPGYYRKRRGRGGPYEPVLIAIGPDGKAIARVGNDAVDAYTIWQWCAGNPVSEKDARTAFETGKWSGDIDESDLTPRIGDNSGDLTLEQEIADACESALSWLTKLGTVKSQDDATRAQNLGDKIAKLAKRADEQRDAEKRPHLEAGRAVDAQWRPWIDQAKDTAAQLRAVGDAWVKAENARLKREHDERVARERAEAERARQEALDKARAEIEAKGGSDLDVILAEPEDLPEPPPIPAAPPRVMIGGQYGKRSGGRKVISYVIEDVDKVLIALRDHADLLDIVQKLVNRAGKAGIILDGVKRVEE